MFKRQSNPIKSLPLLLSLLWTPVEAGQFDGVWRTEGYGAVVNVVGNTATIYQETDISFFPVEEVQLNGNRVNLGLPPKEEIYELRLAGDRLIAEHRTSTLYLDRVDSLPAVRGASSDPLNVFNVYWATIEENFASFPLLDLDWQATRDEFQERITPGMSPSALFDVLGDMGALLLDGHTTLYAPELNRFRNTGPRPSPLGDGLARKVILNIEREFIDGGSFSEIPLDDRFAYGTMMNGAVGYVAIFDYEYRVVTFGQSLDAILVALADTEMLVIDLRDNAGATTGTQWRSQTASPTANAGCSPAWYAPAGPTNSVHPPRTSRDRPASATRTVRSMS